MSMISLWESFLRLVSNLTPTFSALVMVIVDVPLSCDCGYSSIQIKLKENVTITISHAS